MGSRYFEIGGGFVCRLGLGRFAGFKQGAHALVSAEETILDSRLAGHDGFDLLDSADAPQQLALHFAQHVAHGCVEVAERRSQFLLERVSDVFLESVNLVLRVVHSPAELGAGLLELDHGLLDAVHLAGHAGQSLLDAPLGFVGPSFGVIGGRFRIDKVALNILQFPDETSLGGREVCGELLLGSGRSPLDLLVQFLKPILRRAGVGFDFPLRVPRGPVDLIGQSGCLLLKPRFHFLGLLVHVLFDRRGSLIDLLLERVLQLVQSLIEATPKVFDLSGISRRSAQGNHRDYKNSQRQHQSDNVNGHRLPPFKVVRG